MNPQEMMNKIEKILDDAHAGILATVDAEGRPRLRWLTPVSLSQWPQTLFAVTAPQFPKVAQLDAQGQIEWMIQTRALDQVVNVRGRISVVDNPSLTAQITEAIGRRLAVFWKVNASSTDFVILETEIEEACWAMPLKGGKEVARFGQPGGETA